MNEVKEFKETIDKLQKNGVTFRLSFDDRDYKMVSITLPGNKLKWQIYQRNQFEWNYYCAVKGFDSSNQVLVFKKIIFGESRELPVKLKYVSINPKH